MSIRTIMVGLFAAICGIAATLGVNQIRSSGKPAVNDIDNQVVVARMNIDQGNQLTREMLEEVSWPDNLTPADSFVSIDDVAGQYAVASFVAHEPVIAAKISASPTFLKVPEGYRGATIVTKSDAAMVGGLIAPGNRVDLILTLNKRHELLGGPLTLTLLENVAVLAVGKITDMPATPSNKKDSYKSVTLLVTQKMAEEINLAAELGTLNLTLRSNDDQMTAEPPKTAVSLRDLLDTAEDRLAEEKNQPKQMEAISELSDRVATLKQLLMDKLDELNKVSEVVPSERKFQIEPGMRAVSIQTPDDSTGVAGLIMPGDKLDVLLTTTQLHTWDGNRAQKSAKAITLLENILVLAVGTHVETDDQSMEPKLKSSVTLMVTPEMARDLNLGSVIGKLKLALRGGSSDEPLAGPRHITNLAEALAENMRLAAAAEAAKKAAAEVKVSIGNKQESRIRVNRGGFSQDIPVMHHKPVAANDMAESQQ